MKSIIFNAPGGQKIGTKIVIFILRVSTVFSASNHQNGYVFSQYLSHKVSYNWLLLLWKSCLSGIRCVCQYHWVLMFTWLMPNIDYYVMRCDQHWAYEKNKNHDIYTHFLLSKGIEKFRFRFSEMEPNFLYIIHESMAFHYISEMRIITVCACYVVSILSISDYVSLHLRPLSLENGLCSNHFLNRFCSNRFPDRFCPNRLTNALRRSRFLLFLLCPRYWKEVYRILSGAPNSFRDEVPSPRKESHNASTSSSPYSVNSFHFHSLLPFPFPIFNLFYTSVI